MSHVLTNCKRIAELEHQTFTEPCEISSKNILAVIVIIFDLFDFLGDFGGIISYRVYTVPLLFQINRLYINLTRTERKYGSLNFSSVV